MGSQGLGRVSDSEADDFSGRIFGLIFLSAAGDFRKEVTRGQIGKACVSFYHNAQSLMKTSGEVNCRKDKKRTTPHKPQHLRSQPNSRKQRTYSNAQKERRGQLYERQKARGRKWAALVSGVALYQKAQGFDGGFNRKLGVMRLLVLQALFGALLVGHNQKARAAPDL